MKRVLTSIVLTLLLLGCGSTTFEPATVKQDYKGKINNLSVVLQTDTMQDAFMLGTAGTHESVVKRRELMARKFTAAVAGISAGIVSSFKEVGVDANVSVATGPYDSAEQAKKITGDQIMLARVVSYMTARQPGQQPYWDSGLSWEFQYFDRNRTSNPTTGVVWRSKTAMTMMGFGCSDDYKDCGERFGKSIVYELQRSELIAKK